MGTAQEPDFPPGHPGRFDFNPDSPEAKEWLRRHFFPKGERDFPFGHPKALDTPGNENSLVWRQGEDPHRPDLEPFTGRTPEQVQALRDLKDQMSAQAKESPALEPVIAPAPPAPGS